ncbi:hypothetical protein D3C86_1984560 [compost metagenome]
MRWGKLPSSVWCMVSVESSAKAGTTKTTMAPMSASFQPSVARKVSRSASASQLTTSPMKPKTTISPTATAAAAKAISANHFLAPCE